MCTDKLALGNAARRVFLDDGTEVFTPQEIMRDAEVYISAGENFKNPYTGVKSKNSAKYNVKYLSKLFYFSDFILTS